MTDRVAPLRVDGSPLRVDGSPVRVDGSMSLLVDIMRDAQDPAYAAARQQARSVSGQDGLATRRRTVAGVAVLALLGLATGTAAAELRAGADDAEATRAELAREVRERTAVSEDLAAQVSELREAVEEVRSRRLVRDAAGRRQAATLARVQLAAAETAVIGPGVVVQIDDRPAEADRRASGRAGQLNAGRVQDRDLQVLVNGLWAAGAEAISVNDVRLTARTAIRSAGEAVLIDFKPVSPPYLIRAIGPPGQLEPDFVDSQAGRRIATQAKVNGLAFSVRAQQRLRLPAGGGADLVFAQPVS